MGFFNIPPAVLAKPAPKKAAKTSKRDIASMPRGCENCSLQANWSWINTPQMPISGNTRDGDILALGEAPGEQEDRDGVAFVGDSGRVLRSAVPGRDLDRLLFQNTVRCHPRNNATPSPRDAHCCSLYLQEDINVHDIKAILGIGGVPLSQFYPGQNITRIHGVKFPVRMGDKVLWYFPVLHPSFALRTGGSASPAMFVLKADITRFFREVDSWGTPTIWTPDPSEVLCPQTEEEARFYLSNMKAPYGIDLETQRLKPYLKGAMLLTAAIADDDISMAFPIEHPEAANNWGLKLLLEIAEKNQWIAHNAAFELTWMIYKAQEVDIPFTPHAFEDSMACGRLYHERETVLGLDMLTRIHLGTDIKTLAKVNLNNMVDEPLERVLPYNGLDAQSSVRLWKMIRPKVSTVNYDRFIETVHSTARMELLGLTVDLDLSNGLKDEWTAINTNARSRAQKLYEVRKFEEERQIEFNIGSSEHVGIALVEYGKVDLPKTSSKGDDGKKVDGTRWSTDDADLRAAAPDNPVVECVIDFRESQKQISTYIDATLRHAGDSVDGRMHPSYSTMLTATTRLSCVDPNAQNYPKRRHRGLRRQVIPDRVGPDNLPRDHIFIAADMGQIDARIYGCATKDRALVESFINDIDIHSKWRDRALEVYPEYLERLAHKTNETDEKKIIKGARDVIKSDFVFASFYGSSAGACAQRTGIPVPKTTQLVGDFWKEYPDAFRWLKNQRRLYSDTGSIRTLCGVERHGILWGNEVINTPIQGTTAHIVNDAQNALSRLSLEVDDPYIHPRINIHDDLTFVVPDDEDSIDRYIKVIAKEMLAIRYDWQIVPFTVEFKVGYNWCDLEDVTTIKGEYLR